MHNPERSTGWGAGPGHLLSGGQEGSTAGGLTATTLDLEDYQNAGLGGPCGAPTSSVAGHGMLIVEIPV